MRNNVLPMNMDIDMIEVEAASQGVVMNQLYEVLRQVQAGTKRFAPEVSTSEAVKAFQPTAIAIKHANNDHGYLSAVFRQSEMIDTYGCILEAVVTSPLYYEGLRFLEMPKAAPESTKF
jgi:hypothetical protein